MSIVRGVQAAESRVRTLPKSSREAIVARRHEEQGTTASEASAREPPERAQRPQFFRETYVNAAYYPGVRVLATGPKRPASVRRTRRREETATSHTER